MSRNFLEWLAHEPFDLVLRDREDFRINRIVVFDWRHPQLDTRRSSPCPMRLYSAHLAGRSQSDLKPLNTRGVGKDRAKMANRAGEHEEMPDKMIVPDALVHEEDDAAGISNTAREKPNHGF